MKIITLITSRKYDAGPKAPRDIETILSKKYKLEKDTLYVKKDTFFERINFAFGIVKTILKNIGYKDVLFIQYPFTNKSDILLKFLPTKKTIVIIHDITFLRLQDDKKMHKEINTLKRYKYIVVHNSKMKKLLEENGIDANKMYELELFDYLCKNPKTVKLENRTDKTVVYAGNLVQRKSPFIYQLEETKMNFNLNLYGVGLENDISKKIIYKGKYLPDELPNHLDGSLGLVWDGKMDESDENESFKNYTKYNNPHKLSCYIAAGLPVIVWDKAAVSKFVKENNIGYTINNIYDINKIDLKDYEEKLKNVINIRKKVLNGEYTKNVIEKILKDMGE